MVFRSNTHNCHIRWMLIRHGRYRMIIYSFELWKEDREGVCTLPASPGRGWCKKSKRWRWAKKMLQRDQEAWGEECSQQCSSWPANERVRIATTECVSASVCCNARINMIISYKFWSCSQSILSLSLSSHVQSISQQVELLIVVS